jgi:hypothetical protein
VTAAVENGYGVGYRPLPASKRPMGRPRQRPTTAQQRRNGCGVLPTTAPERRCTAATRAAKAIHDSNLTLDDDAAILSPMRIIMVMAVLVIAAAAMPVACLMLDDVDRCLDSGGRWNDAANC